MKYIVGEVDFSVKKHIFEPQRSIYLSARAA